MPDPPEDDSLRTRNDGTRAPIWLDHEPILHLREWETDQVHPMPGPDIEDPVVGADPSVAVRLVDPTRSVSRRHARLIRVEGGWEIEDLHSRYGVRCDGGRATSQRFLITAGMEIGIGGITLVAENATLVRLKQYLERVLGWDTMRRPAIELALRAVRAAALGRAPLTLVGADDVVAVARQIHLRATRPGAPFVVCGKKPHASDESLRVTATIADASAALERAAGGTVCVRADKRFAGHGELVGVTSKPQAVARLYQCTKKVSKRVDRAASGIVIPKLARRSPEDLDRIVAEYATDAVRELGADPASFTEQQRVWVVRYATTSFAELEITAVRFAVRNAFESMNQAAAYLGLSHVTLGDWFKRRKLRP